MSFEKARLEEEYYKTICPALMKQLNIKNIMAVPRLSKIVLNVGIKDAAADSKIIQTVEKELSQIAGQKAVRTMARKSIAGFKIREGMAIGVMVTLRKKRMYEFFDRLLAIVLPKVRDFQGVTTKFDGRGGYNLGIKEWIVFPEVEYDVGGKMHGLNISIQTTSKNDASSKALLEAFGMPFKKNS